MKRVEGSAGVSLLECTNPVKGKWRIRWDVQKKEDDSASYMEEEFNHKPTDEEIRSTVTAWYNRETDKAILSGFIYDSGMAVKREPVQLQSCIRSCRPNGRAEPASDVQAGCG